MHTSAESLTSDDSSTSSSSDSSDSDSDREGATQVKPEHHAGENLNPAAAADRLNALLHKLSQVMILIRF